MRAAVLTRLCAAWEAGPRSAAELKEAAVHYERAVALHPAPEVKSPLRQSRGLWCRATAGVV